METRLWTISVTEAREGLTRHPIIIEAAARLKEGKLVAFPTETVYGLGADATNDEAVEAVFRAKGRPSDNPLIVHIGSRRQVGDVARHISPLAETLMNRFWPGPLTVILPSAKTVSEKATAGLDTVAVRLPDHPVAQALLVKASRPIVAPSANRSGRPSPTEAKHVLDDLAGLIDAVLDGGKAGYGLESTVVDVTGDVPVVLRPGGVTVEALREVVPTVVFEPLHLSGCSAPRSPGMKYRHYAPNGRMELVTGTVGEMIEHIRSRVKMYKQEGWKVGVLTTEEHASDYDADIVIACGRRGDLHTVAQRLYESLRQFDEAGAERILAETFPRSGPGEAIMNRLMKAAEGRVL